MSQGIKQSLSLTFPWLPCDSDGKETACNVGDLGLILGSGRSAGNPLQYSFLESSVDRGARWATVHGIVESQT